MSFLKGISNQISGFISKMAAPLVAKHLGSPIRHALTFLGGYLIANELASAAIVNQAVMVNTDLLLAVAVTLIGQGASLVEKSKRE